ncbi:MAG: DUF3662 domain-containing protein [Actinobacteria bacterium]|nr:DUF3662 domain-containing protein [Actinomycetota bacterium]
MTELVVLLVGAVVGFAGSRRLRRPDRAAQAASVARAVGGTLGTRRGLSAPELQRACFSEMVRHVRVTRQGRTHAPSGYLLSLHPDDLAVVDEARRWFTEGLADALQQAARDNGWVLDGPVEIDFQADPARHRGVPGALVTSADPDPTPPPPPAPPPAAPAPRTSAPGRTFVLVRADTGERIPLRDPLTIGRSRDRDVTVDDGRVSRAHARVERLRGGWAVVDEGSANGTTVDGEAVVPHRPHALRPGSVIGVGPVELRVAAVAAGQPGTRALDDQERTRISGEVLPPDRGEPR